MNWDCPICGKRLIWDNDFTYEDPGLDGIGTVSFYHCECGIEIELYQPEGEEENEMPELREEDKGSGNQAP